MDLMKILYCINENYDKIVVFIMLGILVFMEAKSFITKSDEEKEQSVDECVAIAKSQIKETMLRFVSDAESDWIEWNKSGAIKRAQVISDIYYEYPILSRVADQEQVIKWIDSEIDNALPKLRDIIENMG